MGKSNLKTYVSIILLGDDIDPDLITEQLNIKPTSMHTKGLPKKTPLGTEYSAKTGLWSYDVDMPDGSLNDIVSNIISKFIKTKLSTSDLFDRNLSFIDVLMMADTDDEGEITFEFDLTMECLSGLKDLNLPIQFTATVIHRNVLPYGTHNGFILP